MAPSVPRGLRSPRLALASAGVAVIAGAAIVMPIVFGTRASAVHPDQGLAHPSAQHWFGTDHLGRDILFRTLTATRLTIVLALLATALALVIGSAIGASLGLAPRPIRQLGARLIDFALAFPPVLVAIFVTAIFGPSAATATVAIGLALTPMFARLTSTLAAAVAGTDYVLAARLLGVSPPRVLLRYLVPNIAGPVLVQATLSVGSSIIGISSLSFLGLGVQPPSYDWGQMLTEGASNIYTLPAAAMCPAIAIALTSIILVAFGDTMSALVDPRTAMSSGRPRKRSDLLRVFRVARPFPRPASAAAVATEVLETGEPVLAVENLRVVFGYGKAEVAAVESVTFSIARGETLAVVGESGSGKSVTALAVSNLIDPSGTVTYDSLRFRGVELAGARDKRVRATLANHMVNVFQDPGGSLNPALRLRTQLTESVRRHTSASRRMARQTVLRALADVRLPATREFIRRRPAQLSGGMQQRTTIAAGLANAPALIIADEPTTALDVTVQSQILAVLKRAQREAGASMLFISHDMSVVQAVSDRVIVMYAGRMVESGPTEQIMSAPAHPYTQALIGAIPRFDPDNSRELVTIPGRQPRPGNRSPGCAFAPRCAHAMARCHSESPVLKELVPGHHAACWLLEDRRSLEEIA